jgi:hypothetical protein
VVLQVVYPAVASPENSFLVNYTADSAFLTVQDYTADSVDLDYIVVLQVTCLAVASPGDSYLVNYTADSAFRTLPDYIADSAFLTLPDYTANSAFQTLPNYTVDSAVPNYIVASPADHLYYHSYKNLR